MHRTVFYLPLVCTLAVVVVAECQVRTPTCQTGQFYHVNSQKCRACSVCPADQIVRRPCTLCQDVLCGHFVEFGNFNQHSGEQPLSMNSTVRPDQGSQNRTDPVSTEDSWRELSVALVVVLSVLSAVTLGIVVYVCWRRRQANNKETCTVVYQRGSQAMHGDVSPEEVPSASNEQQPEARYVFV